MSTTITQSAPPADFEWDFEFPHKNTDWKTPRVAIYNPSLELIVKYMSEMAYRRQRRNRPMSPNNSTLLRWASRPENQPPQSWFDDETNPFEPETD